MDIIFQFNRATNTSISCLQVEQWTVYSVHLLRHAHEAEMAYS